MIGSVPEHIASKIQYVLLCLTLFVHLNLASLLNQPILGQLGLLNLFVKVGQQDMIYLHVFGLVYIYIYIYILQCYNFARYLNNVI